MKKDLKPVLVILAAGLGSRYGNLKQIDKVGPSGERIIDYSVYDALRAGFSKIIFVIRKNIEDQFHKEILSQLPTGIETDYIFQELDSIPSNDESLLKRVKPWGTGHALLCASHKIENPFVVINADDFYGLNSFKLAYKFLLDSDFSQYHHSLIGFKLSNTLSENGSVSRAICKTNSQNYITSIIEYSKILKKENKILYKNNNDQFKEFVGNEIVSMNMFAFKRTIFKNLEESFKKFLKSYINNSDAEFYLPTFVNELIEQRAGIVKVNLTPDHWFGLTYKNDKTLAMANITTLIGQGIYPEKLW